jgi:hypothetical protein
MSAEQALIWTSKSLACVQSLASSAYPVETAMVAKMQDIRIRFMALLPELWAKVGDGIKG